MPPAGFELPNPSKRTAADPHPLHTANLYAAETQLEVEVTNLLLLLKLYVRS
jgi:hypothetical protein